MLIGSLCTGYGGLDFAAQQIFNADIAWVADNGKPAQKLLAYRYPDIPNLDDFTKTNWKTVPRVDILTAGFPCQPVSIAGRKLGKNDERWIWPFIPECIRVLRPGYICLENVAAITNRGMSDVLGSLALLGYDAEWTCVQAAEVGAPHHRDRWFLLAYPGSRGFQQRGIVGLVGNQAAEESCERGQRERDGDTFGDSCADASYTVRSGLQGGAWEECSDGIFATGNRAVDWGRFEPAIRGWERILGRPAPVPVIPGKTKDRLNPVFVEWMQGLDDGWVTDVPGLSYREQLHLLGNGCVPQQAEYAYRSMLSVELLAA